MSRRFVFLGWLAVAALASPARLRAQEGSRQADADRAATGRGACARAQVLSSCPSVARWCRATRRFFITARSRLLLAYSREAA